VVALYPPAWRARYRQEALELLCDLGYGAPAAASMAWRAVPAWLWPPRHLHDQAGRMRASLATTLVAWSMLAGLGLVFEQLTQQQPILPPGHAVIGWSYAVFDAAFVLSGLTLAAGGLPLWLLMLRRGWVRRLSPGRTDRRLPRPGHGRRHGGRGQRRARRTGRPPLTAPGGARGAGSATGRPP
jgi:hypothetical protein